MELIAPEERATGFDAIFCPRCGQGPDVLSEPVIVAPTRRGGEVLYRYSCSGRPACLGTVDLAHEDLRILYRQIRASEFGVHLKHMARIRDRLAKEADDAPESKDRIAAARALHRFTREALEDAQIVERKPVALPIASGETIRIIPGSLVEKKLRERAEMRNLEMAGQNVRTLSDVSVPEPADIEAPGGI